MYNFRMTDTDTDTESFHSAVNSLSDREDASSINTNVKSEETDEGRKVNPVQDNKYEFGGSS